VQEVSVNNFYHKPMTQTDISSLFITIDEQLKPALLVCGKPGDGLTNSPLIDELKKDYRVTCIYSEDRLIEYVLRFWTPDDGLGACAILLCESVGLNTGTELLRSLRTMGESAETPVLVLSMDGSDLGADIWLESGANGVVLKSEDPERHASVVRRGLNYWTRTLDENSRQALAA
jgi:DNA-binding NarL/FixJ family response regulator